MVGGVKGKIISLFKTNTTKNYSELARDNNVFGVCKKPRKLKIKKKQPDCKIVKAMEDRIIKHIKILFEKKKKNY